MGVRRRLLHARDLRVAFLSAASVPYVGKEVVPDDDQGEFSINVKLLAHELTSGREFIKPLEQEVLGAGTAPETRGSRQALRVSMSRMTPLEERKISQQDMMRRALALLQKYRARDQRGGRHGLSGASAGFGAVRAHGQPVEPAHPGPDIDQLQTNTVALMGTIRTIRGVVDVDSNFEPTQPEPRINVARTRAADSA